MKSRLSRWGASVICALILLLCLENLLFAQARPTPDEESEQGLYMLCYHDVAKYVDERKTPNVIAPEVFESHILELRKKGYELLSIQDYVAICRGEKSKPDKAVVITFDDGYSSFYQTIYPILQKHRVPAMMAIIGSWMDGGAGRPITMSTWEQFQEMEASGLVTVASHTYDLHKPVYINERGDMASAVASRLYRGGLYESDEAYADRLRYDFQKAQAQFERNLGHRSDFLVWPYGDYNETALQLAKEAGFKGAFQLGDGWNVPSEQDPQNADMLFRARRIMMHDNVPAKRLIGFMRSYVPKNRTAFRLARVDLAQLYVPGDLVRTDANIDMLVERLFTSNVGRVILNVAEDADGDGKAEAVYFHNRQNVPLKADVANHFIGRLRAEGFTVYAWMPATPANWRLPEMMTEERISGLFQDLAVFTPTLGLYFEERRTSAADIAVFADTVRTDFRAARLPRAVSIAAVPLQSVLDVKKAQDLLRYYDYLLVNIQADEAMFPQWRDEVAQALPAERNLRESVIFSFQTRDEDGEWTKAKTVRRYSEVLREHGFYLFGFSQESDMEEWRWYLPNIYASSTAVWKRYEKTDNSEVK